MNDPRPDAPMVGEQGPELIAFPADARIIPHDPDPIRWEGRLTVRKWPSQEAYDAGQPPDETRRARNLLLDGGAALIFDLLIDAGGDPLSNANARIGVGNSNTAASAAQIALQGTSTFFRTMEAGSPSRSGRVLTFVAVFGGSEANFDWREAVLDNGTTVLNRVVAGVGTKTSGAVWTAEFQVSI